MKFYVRADTIIIYVGREFSALHTYYCWILTADEYQKVYGVQDTIYFEFVLPTLGA